MNKELCNTQFVNIYSCAGNMHLQYPQSF